MVSFVAGARRFRLIERIRVRLVDEIFRGLTAATIDASRAKFDLTRWHEYQVFFEIAKLTSVCSENSVRGKFTRAHLK